MNRWLQFFTICLATVIGGGCSTHEIAERKSECTICSPDGKLQARITTKGTANWSVTVDGQRVLNPSRLGLRFRDGMELGHDIALIGLARRSVDSTWENLYGKHRRIRDHYNELRLVLREGPANGRTFEIIVRAFDDGVAFRYVLP